MLLKNKTKVQTESQTRSEMITDYHTDAGSQVRHCQTQTQRCDFSILTVTLPVVLYKSINYAFKVALLPFLPTQL